MLPCRGNYLADAFVFKNIRWKKLILTHLEHTWMIFKRVKYLIFLTNNFHLTVNEIVQLYKHRWKIELFFKWIKQHLKIKSFWGHSENAVKTQVCIAVSVYALVDIAKKKFMLQYSLYEILQVVSISIFERCLSIHYCRNLNYNISMNKMIIR